ncbi:hypothetical protein OK349_16170 [Sphingomonas sp. BT-65]|uniref:hypothetical protein n=1 Tax=Sphingomonas sp. BT-65 TaxID=2989821 RepID=UPI002236BB32|nr:hypothetical protein [Sphingomonas sp. BT-65]MCW4463250.1 hypothetical protein [Sphingomonas sp. BT-65]
MKAFVAILVLGGTLLAAPASTRTAQPASPLLGSWAVDLARLPMPPEARPKRVTITYSEASDGKWRTQVEVLGNDGSRSQAMGTYWPDGTSYPVEGNLEADTAAVKLPMPNVMVQALAKGGVPASMRTYTVAMDGKTMTETVVFFTPDGKPVMRTNYFNRVG